MTTTVKLPDIDDAINFDPKVGPNGIYILGIPGCGKTVTVNRICHQCLQRNDVLLYRGDINCEWQHLIDKGKNNLPWAINLYYPQEANIIFHSKNHWEYVDKYNVELRPISLVDFTPKKLVPKLEAGTLTVIYDEMFELSDRASFWADMAESLVYRRNNLDNCITWIENEAGVLFQLNASDKHAKAISKIALHFVQFRKNIIRPAWIAQLGNEIDWRISQKLGAEWKIYPGKFVPDRSMPKAVKDSLITAETGRMIIVQGALYNKNNINYNFIDFPFPIRMIPPEDKMKYRGGESTRTTKHKKYDENDIYIAYSRGKGLSFRNIADLIDLKKTAVGERIQKMKLNDKENYINELLEN